MSNFRNLFCIVPFQTFPCQAWGSGRKLGSPRRRKEQDRASQNSRTSFGALLTNVRIDYELIKCILVARQYSKWSSECSTLCLELGFSELHSHKLFKTTFHHKNSSFSPRLWNPKSCQSIKNSHILHVVCIFTAIACPAGYRL